MKYLVPSKRTMLVLALAAITLLTVGVVYAGVLTEDDKLAASDGAADDQFGISLAMDGTTVVVGAWGDDDLGIRTGSAYVFKCVALNCTQVSKLTPTDAIENHQFGYAVAVSGATALVGAQGDMDGGISTGAAYVFDLSTCAATCNETAKLTASDPTDYAAFGVSVALDGSTGLVGASGAEGFAGAGYVFDLATCGAACNEEAKLTASDGEPNDFLGYPLALDGATAVLSAFGDDDLGLGAGAAYVFDLATCGAACNETIKLTASDGAADDRFGNDVDVEGSMVLVGADLDDDAGSSSGSAYLFDLTTCGASCNEVSKLIASDAATIDQFGVSVALSGPTAVVGAINDDLDGSAYVFTLPTCGATCDENVKLGASDAGPGDLFGWSVAASGEAAVVSAPGWDLSTMLGVGQAYYFEDVKVPPTSVTLTGLEGDNSPSTILWLLPLLTVVAAGAWLGFRRRARLVG